MKKLSIFFVSVLALGLSVACSSDDDNASIEGKWEAYQDGTIVNGKETLAPITSEGGCSKGFLEIQAGGKVIDHYSSYSNSKCEDHTDNGTWTRTDNKITFQYGDDSQDTGEILVLDKNTLKIKYTYTYNNEVSEIYIIELKRK
ncbi:lipocalin family protein [Flavobacterium sp. LHD-85]|uniref:lipocalin family protein n=1 Tax=Flavobacterium sp. LHD-85 TaxID=3071410 RepID=UPI0027E0D751|nr:lipocalin family protein [Flavobacterium sp. LHD-85]MDQ6527984.1 lipocalin family protein [Flavobacterium sp. LHD-85]